MHKIRLKCDDTLLDGLLYLRLYILNIMSFFLQGFPEGCQQPLGPLVVLLEVLIWSLVVLRLLVKREVGKMHEHILHVLGSGLPIVFSAKTCKTLVAKIGLYWVESFDQNIETQVKFLLFE